jgi:hypothetical protein
MKPAIFTTKLNWIVTIAALAMATVVAISPAFS